MGLSFRSKTMINEQLLRDGLRELASKDMQERLWVQGDNDKMSSFTEAICTVFDDAEVTRAMESGHLQKNFSYEFCCKIDELDSLIRLVPEDAAPKETIEHPKMEDIRHLSLRLLELLEEQRTVSRHC